jgi:hypothetical protein
MTSVRRTSRTLLVVAALGALTLTACGAEDGDATSGKTPGAKASPTAFADLPGGKIADTAFSETAKVRALRIRGNVNQNGERTVLDLRTDRAGRCAGTMSVGAGKGRFVATQKSVFLKGDTAFWKQGSGEDPSQVIDYLDGRWAKLGTVKEFRTLCKIGKAMATEAATGNSWGIDVSKVTRFEGHDVVTLSDRADGERAQIVISADAPHYLRKIAIHSAKLSGEIVLSAFGDKTPIDLPAAGEYVDLE